MNKTKAIFIMIGLIFLFQMCAEQDVTTPQIADELSANGNSKNFTAHLNGDQEVPAAVTNATGQAIFKLSKDGMSMSYKLIVANIEDVRMAHIHLAPAGQNGPVVVWLYPSAPPPLPIPGKTNGILAEGVFDASNFAGPLAGSELSDLIDLMKDGRTYVNVHTDAYPGGEIRGQIK